MEGGDRSGCLGALDGHSERDDAVYLCARVGLVESPAAPGGLVMAAAATAT